MDSMNNLSFRISTGLKNIIGRDLISDKFIAVFELVKNSYDAGAHSVVITFQDLNGTNPQIIISDDGCGMSYDDILGKWLFVAYSAKKGKNNDSFRNSIKRNLAGAKGVGRFSCDRLGSKLTLATKTDSDSKANVIHIDWDKFEVDDSQEFMSIPVQYHKLSSLPDNAPKGTILTISGLREEWDRASVLKLKKSLMKLINPDIDDKNDPFSITFNVPEMLLDDEKIRSAKKKRDGWEREIVNGVVVNDVFEKMNLKTTNIKVVISADGKKITTELYDRGEFIFKFSEKNTHYPLLHDITISLFYLNKSAKAGFTRLMGGVQPVNYGSVFIYKNGFRINPYGEPGEDFFNIDKRKAQGYNRNLGTREIMGRISIHGDNDGFVETSSRAHGFVNTPAVESLGTFFLQKVLKVIERYVVNIINWGEPLKSDPNGKTIMPLETPEAIIAEFADLSRRSDIIEIDYNPALLTKKDKSGDDQSLSVSIEKLERAAQKAQSPALAELAKTVRDKTSRIMSHNISLEKQNAAQENALREERVAREAREKQVYFLQGLTENSAKNLIGGMHSIYTNTEVVRGNIQGIRIIIESADFEGKSSVLSYLAEIAKANAKANKMAELAIKGNQHLKQTEPSSLSEFVQQYIDIGIALKGLRYTVSATGSDFICTFDPTSIGIIIDNVVSNSLKAKASSLCISFREDSHHVFVAFCDDGVGIDPAVSEELIFELGLSINVTKKGFGIGLNEIKELAEDMGGTAKVIKSYTNGFGLEVSIAK